MMKKYFLTLILSTLVLTGFAQLKVGDKAPDFNLLNTDGKMIALSDYNSQEGVIVIFTCNHCPYAKYNEQRMKDLHKHYAKKKFPVVAINPNDSAAYKTDGFSYMVAKNYQFPYLLDDKGVYKQYGATKTPHVFLLEKKADQFNVAYIGAIDDSPQDAADVGEKYLEMAIKAIKDGKTPKYTTTKAIGCGIKPFK